MSTPRATVREVDGRLELHDPDALAVVRAVAKHNCKALLELNAERARHFLRRMRDRGDSPAAVLVVVLNVDDDLGSAITDLLMPGQEGLWAEMRRSGQVPVARGLAGREGIQEMLDDVDKDAAEKLRALDGPAIVVVDHGVAEVFTAADVTP